MRTLNRLIAALLVFAMIADPLLAQIPQGQISPPLDLARKFSERGAGAIAAASLFNEEALMERDLQTGTYAPALLQKQLRQEAAGINRRTLLRGTAAAAGTLLAGIGLIKAQTRSKVLVEMNDAEQVLTNPALGMASITIPDLQEVLGNSKVTLIIRVVKDLQAETDQSAEKFGLPKITLPRGDAYTFAAGQAGGPILFDVMFLEDARLTDLMDPASHRSEEEKDELQKELYEQRSLLVFHELTYVVRIYRLIQNLSPGQALPSPKGDEEIAATEEAIGYLQKAIHDPAFRDNSISQYLREPGSALDKERERLNRAIKDRSARFPTALERYAAGAGAIAAAFLAAERVLLRRPLARIEAMASVGAENIDDLFRASITLPALRGKAWSFVRTGLRTGVLTRTPKKGTPTLQNVESDVLVPLSGAAARKENILHRVYVGAWIGTLFWAAKSLNPLIPPAEWRVLFPLVVLFSVAVFATGVYQILIYRRSRPSLVYSGIYRFTRNPMYLSQRFIDLSFAVVCAQFGLWHLIPAFALVALMNDRLVAWEETRLTLLHGQPYLDYMKQVPRWVSAASFRRNSAGRDASPFSPGADHPKGGSGFPILLHRMGFVDLEALRREASFNDLAAELEKSGTEAADLFYRWGNGRRVPMPVALAFGHYAAGRVLLSGHPEPEERARAFQELHDWLDGNYAWKRTGPSPSQPFIGVFADPGLPSQRILMFQVVDSRDNEPSGAHYFRRPDLNGMKRYLIQVQASSAAKGDFSAILHDIIETAWRAAGHGELFSDKMARAGIHPADSAIIGSIADSAPYSPGMDHPVPPGRAGELSLPLLPAKLMRWLLKVFQADAERMEQALNAWGYPTTRALLLEQTSRGSKDYSRLLVSLAERLRAAPAARLSDPKVLKGLQEAVRDFVRRNSAARPGESGDSAYAPYNPVERLRRAVRDLHHRGLDPESVPWTITQRIMLRRVMQPGDGTPGRLTEDLLGAPRADRDMDILVERLEAAVRSLKPGAFVPELRDWPLALLPVQRAAYRIMENAGLKTLHDIPEGDLLLWRGKPKGLGYGLLKEIAQGRRNAARERDRAIARHGLLEQIRSSLAAGFLPANQVPASELDALSDEQLIDFVGTLVGYPLNLRTRIGPSPLLSNPIGFRLPLTEYEPPVVERSLKLMEFEFQAYLNHSDLGLDPKTGRLVMIRIDDKSPGPRISPPTQDRLFELLRSATFGLVSAFNILMISSHPAAPAPARAPLVAA